MSEENVEIVRRVLDANERRDLASAYASIDPKIEWHVGRLMAQSTGSGQVGEVGDLDPVYYGRDGILAFWRSWIAAWETVSFAYPEFIDAGDVVIVTVSQHARGRASGIELDREYATVWTLESGRITRMEFFPTRNDALEAAGLSE
jgi:ketosteroid isomerase-like protein